MPSVRSWAIAHSQASLAHELGVDTPCEDAGWDDITWGNSFSCSWVMISAKGNREPGQLGRVIGVTW